MFIRSGFDTLFLYTVRVSSIANDDYDAYDDDDDDGNGDAEWEIEYYCLLWLYVCVREIYLFDSRLQFYPS